MGKLSWSDLGGGAQGTKDGRFYLAVHRRFLGPRGTERWVEMTDRAAGTTEEFDSVRAAKAAAEKAGGS